MNKLTLTREGLVMYLLRGEREIVEYQACTHGGWTKYEANGQNPIAHFEHRADVLHDADQIAKYYNSTLEIEA